MLRQRRARSSWCLILDVQKFLKVTFGQRANPVERLDLKIESQSIASVPQYLGNDDKDLDSVIFLNLHVSVKKILKA